MLVVSVKLLLHQVLDQRGGIRWLWPFSRAELTLSHAEARWQPWYLNFAPSTFTGLSPRRLPFSPPPSGRRGGDTCTGADPALYAHQSSG